MRSMRKRDTIPVVEWKGDADDGKERAARGLRSSMCLMWGEFRERVEGGEHLVHKGSKIRQSKKEALILLQFSIYNSSEICYYLVCPGM
jgi:hypothetical protein